MYVLDTTQPSLGQLISESRKSCLQFGEWQIQHANFGIRNTIIRTFRLRDYLASMTIYKIGLN